MPLDGAPKLRDHHTEKVSSTPWRSKSFLLFIDCKSSVYYFQPLILKLKRKIHTQQFPPDIIM